MQAYLRVIKNFDEKIGIIRQYIEQGKTDLDIRTLALDIVRRCASHDAACEIQKLHDYVRLTVAFRDDVVDVDTFQWARNTLELRAGDCDDFAILLGAMLESIGRRVKLVVVSARPDGRLEHIYLKAFDGHEWTPLDPSLGYEAGETYESMTGKKFTNVVEYDT